MSEADLVTGANSAAAPTSLCPLCCEVNLSDESTTSDVTLSICHHRSCRACLAKWMEREETTGQTTPPTCPFCRSTICAQDVLLILGRPFQPSAGSNNGTQVNTTDEIDDLTMQWITEHTVPCRVCGAFIEKHSGCDLMECLCGYRFCYNCGVAGGTCGCNGPRHGFLNDYYIADAPIRDGRSGVVDLRSCIRRRMVRQERENERYRRDVEEMDTWTYSDKNVDLCTVNGRWLFAPKKNTSCVSMLMQQLSQYCISSYRNRKAHEQEIQQLNESVDTSWLFLRAGSDIRAMQQFLARGEIRSKREHARKMNRRVLPPRTSLDLSWIFVRRGAEVRILRHFLSGHHQYLRMQKRRLMRRLFLECECHSNLETPWIFLPQGADIRAMKQYLSGYSVRMARQDKKRRIATEEESLDRTRDLDLVWLFLPPKVGLRILQGQRDAIRRRLDRSKVRDDDISFGATDDLINSGAWIFENVTRAESLSHLVRVFEQLKEECDIRASTTWECVRCF